MAEYPKGIYKISFGVVYFPGEALGVQEALGFKRRVDYLLADHSRGYVGSAEEFLKLIMRL